MSNSIQELIQQLDNCIGITSVIPDVGNNTHVRWGIYQLLQAQQSDGDCAIYKELRCSIHLGLMGEHENSPPVTLPCGHTYCKECIKPIIQARTYNREAICPDCRTPIKLSLNDLKTNIAIKAIVDRLIPRII